MNKNHYIPAWLFAIGIFAQLLMVFLNGHLIWKQSHPAPAPWALDSTAYYKALNAQGNLNLRLYETQQSHQERLRLLDARRKARHRAIDSLSGPALQREIDRQYNRQQQNRTPESQTNSTNRNGSPAGTARQSRSVDASGRSAVARHPDFRAEPGHSCPEPGYHQAEPTSPGDGQRPEKHAGIGKPLPEETARSQVGKLDRSGGIRALYSRQTQVNLTYWRLIQTQNLSYPDVAFSISAVETGYFRHHPGNNLFGMKKNKRRLYVSVSRGGYCYYIDAATSVADYRAYEQQAIRKYKIPSRSAYVAHICKRYCQHPAYRQRLAKAFQELEKIQELS